MHLVKLTNVNIAGDLVLLVAASHVYKRSISIIQPKKRPVSLSSSDSKLAKRITLVSWQKLDVAPLQKELEKGMCDKM